MKFSFAVDADVTPFFPALQASYILRVLQSAKTPPSLMYVFSVAALFSSPRTGAEEK